MSAPGTFVLRQALCTRPMNSRELADFLGWVERRVKRTLLVLQDQKLIEVDGRQQGTYTYRVRT